MKRKVSSYRYLGNVYPSCGNGWTDLLLEQLKKIDNRLYPNWMPRFMKLFWYWLNNKSPYFIRRCFWDKTFKYFRITTIKEKYGELRIYSCDNDIYEETLKKSWNICECCGSEKNIGTTHGWIKRICEDCAKKEDRNWQKDE